MSAPFQAVIVEDDREMRASLSHLLTKSGWIVRECNSAEAALAEIKKAEPDVVLSDVQMPGMSGLGLLGVLQGDGAPPLVLISAHGDIPMAVKAMQDGAYSFLEKPFDPRRLLQVLRHAAENHRLRSTTRWLRERLSSLTGLDRVLLGQSNDVGRLRDVVFEIAAAGGSVLIEGATGTGKELVARALHRLSTRSDGAFVAINCATLSAGTFEEQMFGVDGFLRKADGGTLFLDEIGACPMESQAKLLRVLETGEISASEKVDLRVVAATNERLGGRVGEGRFRSDLYYRLCTFEIEMPALKDRGEDCVFLFGHFLAQMAETYEVAVPEITTEDIATLLSYEWPGNVRELRHVAERRVLAARKGGGSVAAALRLEEGPDEVPDSLREAVAAFERTLIAKAIRAHEGRMEAVAEALGIGRRTLNEKIVKLGLDKSSLLDG